MAKKSSQLPLKNSSSHTWLDRTTDAKKVLIGVVVLFLIIVGLYHRIIFENMLFADSGDTAASYAWGHAGEHLQTIEGREPLWIPFVFSGMPGFGSLAYTPIDVNYLQHAMHVVAKVVFMNAQMSWFVLHYFLAGVFMFLLARSWKFSVFPSLFAAIVFMLSPYALGLTVAGQGSKMMAFSYIPLLLLLTKTLFEQRNILSVGLLSAAIGTALLTNHVQMVFYGFIVIGLYFLFDIFTDLKTAKTIAVKKTGLFLLTFLIGFGIAAFIYLSVYEYSQYSMRGGGSAGASGGLDFNYATNWSFHPLETLTLLIPSFFGFSNMTYWGWMPFTESTVYVGIIPIILSVLALVYKRNKGTLFFASLAVIILIMSFGRYFFIYDLLFHYFPFFDKFRAPAMVLHLLPLAFGMMAAYGLEFLFDLPSKFDSQKLKKGLYITAGIVGAFLILGVLGKSSIYSSLSGSMFQRDEDLSQLRQYGAQAKEALGQLKQVRFDMLADDYVKFALIAIASLGLILLYLNKKIKANILGIGLIAILLTDLLIIDMKFIDPKPATAIDQSFAPDRTVRFLQNDTTHYRIFPIGQLFMDNSWMYHYIESIGGYSPAKIKIYQEMIDSCLYKGADPAFPLNMNIVNMLNVKYIIAQGRLPEDKFTPVEYDQTKQMVTHLNPGYQQRAFFVDDVVLAKNKTEVFRTLNSPTFNSRTTAILEEQPSVLPQKSDSTWVTIPSYQSSEIKLSAFSSRPSLLVLSEVYYPAGWSAYIDGTETPIFKTNYILRSVVVPAGAHTIEFRFAPKSYLLGLTITESSWVVTGLLILIGLYRRPWIRQWLPMAVKEPSRPGDNISHQS
jgi:hypothetical protein